MPNARGSQRILRSMALRQLFPNGGRQRSVELKTHNSIGFPGRTIPFALRRGVCSGLALIFAFAVCLPSFAQTHRFVPGQILVKPRAGVADADFAGKLNQRGAVQRRTLSRLNVRVVGVDEDKVEATLAALRNDPAVEYAERDFIAEAAFVP